VSILNQKTIAKNIISSGIGLHSGKKVNLKIKEGLPNSGIIFKRTDVKDKNNIVIPIYHNVCETNLCTTISNEDGIKISTIEHLMAAFYGLGIDNAIVEIDSQEVPILDGSAKNWIELIKKSGIKSLNSPIKIIKIEKNVEINDGEKFIKIEKSNVSLDIDFELIYPNCLIGKQRNKINVYNDDLNKLFESRTFCKYEDIDKLKSAGFAKGGSLDNAIVVKEYKILNETGLRNDKEFVNHKILDCLGDLYLSGYKIIGSITCSQGGHSLTNKLLRKLFEDKSNYSIFEVKGKNLPHSFIDKYQLKSIA
tara:strand:- start:2441 stop:3364 length:924 start_codon:yes stop_codon:yes gene_type:complete